MTTRRQFLTRSAGLLAAPLLSGSAGAAIRLGTKHIADDRCPLNAVEAVTLMKSGGLRAEEYAATLLARAETRRDLNAFIALDRDRVLENARAADRLRASGRPLGRLHGLPIPVKDSVLTADYPTTAGTKAFAAYSPRRDAALIQRLKAEGAYVMGKTNLHELSSGFTSNNEIFGPVHNPYDPARIAGGSSGGSAAAVSAGIAPLAVAEDSAGSIRVPAALCGVYGFRPTVGRYPAEGITPLVPLFDTLGPHARSVGDVVLFDAAIAGRETGIRARPLDGVRFGVPRAYFYEGMEDMVRDEVENALVALGDSGAVLVQADIPDAKALLDQTFVPILFHDTWDTLDAWFKSVGVAGGLDTILAQAGPKTRAAYLTTLAPNAPQGIPAEAYRNAIEVARPALIAAVQKYFADNRLDAMVYPQTLCTAPPIGEDDETTINGRKVPIFDALGHTTILAPTCGLPALTFPTGTTHHGGLPVAIEIAALPGMDEALLALALGVEESTFSCR